MVNYTEISFIGFLLFHLKALLKYSFVIVCDIENEPADLLVLLAELLAYSPA